MKYAFLGLFVMLLSGVAVAQKYQTVASGNWSDPTIWQVQSVPGVWSAAGDYPTAQNSNEIVVTKNVTVTVTANLTIDQASIRAGSALHVLDGVELLINNGPGNDLAVNNDGILRLFGESYIAGPGTVVFAGDIYIHSTNPAGAITAGTNGGGNIRNASRVFNHNTEVYYVGTSRQFIGSGHPTETIELFVVNNNVGVTFDNNTLGNYLNNFLVLNGPVTLLNGDLEIKSQGNSKRTVKLNGPLQANGNRLSFEGPNTNLQIAGAGDFGVLPLTSQSDSLNSLFIDITGGGSLTIENSLFVAGETTIENGNLVLQSYTYLASSLTLRNSSILTFQELDLAGDFLSEGGVLSSPGGYLHLLGQTPLSSPLLFSPGSLLYQLEITKANSGPSVLVTENTNLTVQRLILNDGVLHISDPDGLVMANPEITIVAGAISGAAPSFSDPGNLALSYRGSAVSPGLEMPESGIFRALHIYVEGTFTLDRDISVEWLTISSDAPGRVPATMTCGPYNVSVTNFFNEGTFNAPTSSASSGLTFIQGNLMESQIQNEGVFNSLDGKVTFDTNTLILAVGPAAQITVPFHDIVVNGTLESPGLLDVSGDLVINGILVAPMLKLGGDIVNSGQFISEEGYVEFRGLGLQSVAGSSPITFNDILVSNTTAPVAVSIETAHQIRGTLTLMPHAVIDADGLTDSGDLTILSWGDGPGESASVAPLPEGAAILGRATVQRFLPANDNINRYISAAVVGASVAQLQDDFPVTGFFTGSDNGCDGCTQSGASLKYYHERVKGSFDRGYKATPVSGGTNEELLIPGRGYTAYLYNGQEPTIVDLRGTINQGRFQFTQVFHTVSDPPQPEADGWNLVGNPYPSAISWASEAGWERDDLDPTVWVWDVDANLWRSYNYLLGQAQPGTQVLSNGIIASGQAFWVYKFPGNAVTAITEEAKTTEGGSYFRERQSSKMTALGVYLTKDGYSDHAYLVLHENGTDGFDRGLDSYKLEIGIERFSVSLLGTDYKKLGYLALSDVSGVKEIPISISSPAAGDYELSFDFLGERTEFVDLFLVDKLLNVATPVTKSYHFSTSDITSSRDTRFVLTRNPESILSDEEGVPLASCYPNPATEILDVEVAGSDISEIALVDMLGRKVDIGKLEVSKGFTNARFNVASFPNGIYFVLIKNSQGQTRALRVLKD